MRLCVICGTRSIHSRKWLAFFAGQGHDVHAVTFSPPAPPAMEGVTFHAVARDPGAGRLAKAAQYARHALRVRQLVAEIRPDVLNTMFLTDHGLFGALTGFRPYTITPWGSDVLRHPFQKRFWRWGSKYAVRHCDRIFCNSDPMEEGLVKTLGAPRDIIRRVIWAGVDAGVFHPENKAEAKKQLGMEGKAVFFSNRGFEPIYNIEKILEMFALALADLPGARLVLAGGGSLEAKLKEKARSLDIDGRVVFAGYLDGAAMRRWLAASDVYLTVPQSDSCATSLMEAFACDANVVASDIFANRAWINNGQNGRLVDPQDAAAFARACVEAVRHPAGEAMKLENRQTARAAADYHDNMRLVEEEMLLLARAGGAP